MVTGRDDKEVQHVDPMRFIAEGGSIADVKFQRWFAEGVVKLELSHDAYDDEDGAW